jgi:Gpi18-like mannosyltransferase
MLIKKLIKKNEFHIVLFFIASRIFVLLTAIISFYFLPKGRFFDYSGNILNLFIRWDSGWYIKIASEGYKEITHTVFFPLYPLILHLFSYIMNVKVAGFLVSNISFLLASIYLYRLIKIEYKKDIAISSILLMLIFPLTFFFSIIYTEGLFFLLTVSCIYYSRKKNWLLASILGFFTALTKVIGFLIFIPILMEYFDINWEKPKKYFKKLKPDVLFLLLIPLGTFLYMIYQKIIFGSFLSFLVGVESFNRKLVPITKTIINIIIYPPTYQLYFFVSISIALFLIIYMIRNRVRISYIAYSVVMFIVFLSTNLLESVPRYLSAIFPFYIAIGMLSQNKLYRYMIILLSIIFLVFFIYLFVNGYWFT